MEKDPLTVRDSFVQIHLIGVIRILKWEIKENPPRRHWTRQQNQGGKDTELKPSGPEQFSQDKREREREQHVQKPRIEQS